jgi:hypothetical protein
MDNSECVVGMHDYQIVKEIKGGLLERCTKCKDQQFFPEKVSNAVYLSYHLKQFLQPNSKRFKYEYR